MRSPVTYLATIGNNVLEQKLALTKSQNPERMVEGDIDLAAMVDLDSESAPEQSKISKRRKLRHQGPPGIHNASPSLHSTPLGPLAPASKSQHYLTPPVPTPLPRPTVQNMRPPPLPVRSESATPRTYPIVVEFGTGRKLPPGYLDRVRYLVDPDFADENWGDRYMTAIGEQPKYIHCTDLQPNDHGRKDWEAMIAGMIAEADKVDNGEKTKENRMKALVSRGELYGTAIRPTANPYSMIAQAAAEKEEADADFQTFAAAGIRAAIFRL